MKPHSQNELFGPETIPTVSGKQRNLIDLIEAGSRKKITPIPIDHASPNQRARLALDTKYRDLLTDRLDFRRLVTYVPNKTSPSTIGLNTKRDFRGNW